METKQENKKKRPAKPCASFCDDEGRPASDGNPTHREDFTRLLNAAVRKPEPKD
jgi:hypothetical protein